MQYDITFHPSWWHKNVGICFSQEFFDDPGYRMECDIKMRKALYERFGAYGIGEKDPKKRPLLGTNLLAAGYLYSELMGCEILYKEDNSPQVICRMRKKSKRSPVWIFPKVKCGIGQSSRS